MDDHPESQHDQESDDDQAPDWVKKLRKDYKDLQAERDRLLNENKSFQAKDIFDRLGIPSDGPGALFRDKYDGDLTEETVKAEASKYGLLNDTGQASEPPPDTLNSIERQAQAAQGAEVPVSNDLMEALARDDISPEEIEQIIGQYDHGLLSPHE